MEGIQILLTPFVWVLRLFYDLFNSYGVALILFAVLVKVIMFPLSLKGKRSMIQMNMLNGRMEKLKKMYGSNQEKYNMEVQKLYEKEGVTPMGGCLWSLLPVLIIFPLYAIIRQPLTYMMGLTAQQIIQVGNDVLNWAQVSIDNGWVKTTADAAQNLLTEATVNQGCNQLYLSSLINEWNIAAVKATVGESAFVLNFRFLGIDLAQVPELQFWAKGISWDSIGRFLLPVISAGSGLVYSLVSMKTNAVNQQSAQSNNSTNKTMLLISPLLSLWIGFSMPAALSVYWVANSLLSMLQEFIAGKMLAKDYEKARVQQERRAAEEKEEEKRLKAEARIERARRLEEARQNKGKKKKPAKQQEDAPAVDKSASRVGLRAYARGRAYDPYRFSPDGPTPYLDGSAVDDATVEKALEARAEAAEKAREKAEFAEKYQLSEEDMRELEQELPEEPAGEAPAEEEKPTPDDEPEL